MLVKSAIVAEGSGALGGLVWSHNSGGQYLRQRVTPTNPATTRQNVVRTALANLAAAWSNSLTGNERAAWIAYADAVELPGRLGDLRTVSGLNWFIACNVPRASVNASFVDSGPTTLTLAPMGPVAMDAIDTGNQPTMSFSDADPWAQEDNGFMLVQTSMGVQPTINFFKGPYAFTWRLDGDTATPLTSPQDPSIVSGDLFYEPAAGQKVFWRAMALMADGRISAAQTGSAIVA